MSLLHKFASAIICILFAYMIQYAYYGFLSNHDNQKFITKKSATLIPPNPETTQPASASVLHIYENAAVCSDSNLCSNIGKNFLQHKGSAVDAAIGTLLCNGLVAMQSMGLGGGMLMNIYLHNEQRSYSINAREVAPLASSKDMFTNKLENVSEDAFLSSLSIAVPVEVLGYAVAHERFGKIPWIELVQPTIQICHAGYTLTKHQRDALLTNKWLITKDALLMKMFHDNETEQFLRVGAHVQPPVELCQTYESLAVNGPRSFYTGEVSRKLIQDLKDIGSSITELDLYGLTVNIDSLVTVPWDDDYQLHFTPPPASGYIIGYVMNILKKFKEDFLHSKKMGVLETHRIAEALKFGFVKRWQLDINSSEELYENMTCPAYAENIANLINDSKTLANPEQYGATPDLRSHQKHGTAHISVLAPNGDAVSVTSSINFYFGSGRTGKRTGVIFNNAMSDFSIDGVQNYFNMPNVANKNYIGSRLNPMSSMTPLIVTNRNGSVRLVVGAAGGSKIISSLVQILVRIFWFGENIKEAIDAARFHHQLLPEVLEYEYGVVKSVIEALEANGHETQRYRLRNTAVCGIERIDNVIFANADYRKDGGVAGF